MLLNDFYTTANTVVLAHRRGPRLHTNLYPALNDSDSGLGPFLLTLSNSLYSLSSGLLSFGSLDMLRMLNQWK